MNALTITFSEIWSKAWPILVAVLFFGFIIMLHELGHFLFAKLFKVKVNEFALGMGPTLFKFQKGETKYALRLFPIGGFVSMEGEDETSDDERAFSKKKIWQRFIIVASGATTNIILGTIILAIILSTSGELIGTNRIHSFANNAVSSNYGLQAGDVITHINGKRVYSDYDISFLMSRDADGVMDFKVRRDGKKVVLNGVKFDTRKDGEVTTIIYDFIIVGKESSVSRAVKNELKNSNTFFKKSLNVTKAIVVVTGNVIWNALKETVSVVRIVWLSLFDLITGQYGLSDLSGPVGTVTIVADIAKGSKQTMDWTPFLTILAFITINIGVFNLLPLPALDGGRLFFLVIEGIRRKPIKREALVHTIGIILLLLLMVVVTFSDILKLIKR